MQTDTFQLQHHPKNNNTTTTATVGPNSIDSLILYHHCHPSFVWSSPRLCEVTLVVVVERMHPSS